MTSLAWGPVGHCTSGRPLNPPLSLSMLILNSWKFSNSPKFMRTVVVLRLRVSNVCLGALMFTVTDAVHTTETRWQSGRLQHCCQLDTSQPTTVTTTTTSRQVRAAAARAVTWRASWTLCAIRRPPTSATSLCAGSSP